MSWAIWFGRVLFAITYKCKNWWAYGFIPVIPALRRLIQKDCHEFRFRLQSEFQASLGYSMKFCLKTVNE